DLRPQLATAGEVSVDGDGLVELGAEAGDDAGRAPHSGAGAEREGGEGQSVPTVEGLDVLGLIEVDLGELREVAAGVLVAGHSGSAAEFAQLLRGQLHPGGGRDVVVHDRDVDCLGDRRVVSDQGIEVGGVVEGRDDHHGVGSGVLGVPGQFDRLGGAQGSGACDDGDAAGRGLDVRSVRGLALLDGQGGELTGRASGHEPVDASGDDVVDLPANAFDVDGGAV